MPSTSQATGTRRRPTAAAQDTRGTPTTATDCRQSSSQGCRSGCSCFVAGGRGGSWILCAVSRCRLSISSAVGTKPAGGDQSIDERAGTPAAASTAAPAVWARLRASDSLKQRVSQTRTASATSRCLPGTKARANSRDHGRAHGAEPVPRGHSTKADTAAGGATGADISWAHTCQNSAYGPRAASCRRSQPGMARPLAAAGARNSRCHSGEPTGW